MKTYFIPITIALLGLNLISVGQSEQDISASHKLLKVGDPAPPIKVEKWVKGPPVSKFVPGRVYVVEFGATWCTPCRDAIPLLSTLAKKYKDRATVVGFFVWENRGSDLKATEYIGKVERYVEKLGDKIAYSMAVDDPHQTMGNTWLRAAKRNGIPTTFLIDQSGKIVWIGNGIEIAKLDHFVDQLIQDRFDAMSVLREQEDRIKSFRKLDSLINIADYKSALLKVDSLIKMYPSHKYFIKKRFDVLRAIEENTGYAYGWEIFNKALLVNNSNVLFELSSSILSDIEYKNPDYDLAIAFNQQIIEHDNRGYYKARAYKNIAQAWFMKGDPTKGQAMMQVALKNLPYNEYYERRKKLFQKQLERFINSYEIK